MNKYSVKPKVGEHSDIEIQRITLAGLLKRAGYTDVQIMEVVALAQHEELFQALCTRFEDDCETEVSYEELETILSNINGARPQVAGVRNDNKALTDMLAGPADFGVKSRLLNMFQYLSDNKQWDPTYDEQWKHQLREEDICNAARQLVESVPDLAYLESHKFEQQGKVSQALTLASLADEIMVGAERGKFVGRVGIYPGTNPYTGFGNLYGLGKGRVKFVRDVRIPTKELHERLAEATTVKETDYVYVETKDDIDAAYGMGYKRFATAENGLYDLTRATLDRGRGWYLATYTPPQEVRPVYDPYASAPKEIEDRNKENMSKMHALLRQKKEAGELPGFGPKPPAPVQPVAQPAPKEVESPTVEKESSKEVETSTAEKPALNPVAPAFEMPVVKTAAPEVAMNVYSLLKTGPGKTYYLAKHHRGLYVRAFNVMKKHPGSVTRLKVEPMGPTYSPVVPEPPMRSIETGPATNLKIIARVLRLRQTRVQLSREGLIEDGDIVKFVDIKGVKKNTLQKAVVDRAGPEPTEEGLAQAIAEIVYYRTDGAVTDGLLRVAAASMMSLYARRGEIYMSTSS